MPFSLKVVPFYYAEHKRAAEITHGVIDMCRAFEKSIRAHCSPDAQIIYDKFHVLRHLNEALNTVRKDELRKSLGRFKKTLSGKKFNVPGTEKTRNLISGSAFSRMKKGAILINTSRGFVVGTLGRFDVVDIVESDDPELIARAIMILRASGHETTETLMAIPWEEFLASL